MVVLRNTYTTKASLLSLSLSLPQRYWIIKGMIGSLAALAASSPVELNFRADHPKPGLVLSSHCFWNHRKGNMVFPNYYDLVRAPIHIW